MKIYLVRHAETTHNMEGRYYADEHVAFTPRGEEQLKALNKHFETIPLSKVISSPKKRCLSTAENLHCETIERNEAFRDVEQGVYGGLTKQEIVEKYPGLEEKRVADIYHFVYPEGESHEQCEERVISALQSILTTQSEDFAIVTHASPILLILKHVLNISFNEARKIFVYPGSITTIEYRDNTLHLLNKPKDLIGADYSDLKSLVTKMDS